MKGIVYKILNNSNGRYYIGGSVNFKKRKAQHLSSLRNNTHHCSDLQKEFNYYGESSFDFIEIEESESYKDCEQKHIDNSNWDFIYNQSKHSTCGDLISYHKDRDLICAKISKSVKENISKLSKEERSNIWGKKGSENHNWKGGKTFCSCGNRINSYSLSCASCRDRSKDKNPFYGKKHSSETKDIISRKNKGKLPVNTKSVIVDDIEYISVSECARKLNVCTATIIHRIKSKNPKFINYRYK